jgi:hypothetical protein
MESYLRRKLGKHREDAPDVLQEALLKYWQHEGRQQLDDPERAIFSSILNFIPLQRDIHKGVVPRSPADAAAAPRDRPQARDRDGDFLKMAEQAARVYRLRMNRHNYQNEN